MDTNVTGNQLSQEAPVQHRGARCRVLVVSAHDERAGRIARQLSTVKSQSFSVAQSRTIPEAWAAKKTHRPEVVLLDLIPSVGWGNQAVELIPTFADESAIIVLSDRSDDPLVVEALDVDAQDYLLDESLTTELLERSIRYAKERHRLIRAQQRSDYRFRRHVAEDPDGALVTDMKGKLLFANSSALEMMPSLSVGDPVAKVGIQVPGPAEETIVLEDQRTIGVRCSRIEWETRPAWHVQLRDVSIRVQVSDLRARLAQSEKLAVIGQLAAGVAHEINNPLAFILANLSATLGHVCQVQELINAVAEGARKDPTGASARQLLDQAGPELFGELKEMLEDNLDGVDRIRSIVRELKTFSRRENEEHEVVRVHEMVKSACHMVASQIRHRATLVKDLKDVKPVMGNRVKLMQILTNLLMNAAQALPDHRGRQERIEVRTWQNERWVVISVSDTGTGVDPDVKGRIFEPFFTTKPRGVGTGIGLSLSAELARQHNGELVLAKTSATGSTFELRLPMVDPVRLVRPATQTAPVAPPPAVQARSRILLIDDEPNVRKSMTRMLRDYDVVTVGNGREGLKVLEEQSFDAVICDLVMPELDGVDVYDVLAAKKPALLDRVIYTSGGAYTPRTAAFVAKNDILFVEKPVHPKRLMSLIEDVLRESGTDSAPSVASTYDLGG